MGVILKRKKIEYNQKIDFDYRYSFEGKYDNEELDTTFTENGDMVIFYVTTDTIKRKISKMRYIIYAILGIAVILYPVPYLFALDNFEKFDVGIKILGFIGYTVLLWEAAKYLFKSEFWRNYVDKKKG